ncbi:MAG: DUF4396 domain-containing protein [Alistipes finegoldii]
MMQIAMACGFLAALPVNVLLIKAGIKKGCSFPPHPLYPTRYHPTAPGGTAGAGKECAATDRR